MINSYDLKQKGDAYNVAANELAEARRNAVESLKRLQRAESDFATKMRALSSLVHDGISSDYTRALRDTDGPEFATAEAVQRVLTERRIILDDASAQETTS